jgi:putative FmdB family regulatory protein
MPFYEYECASCKFYTEVMQKISDPPLAKCPSCGKKAMKKLVSAPVFRLKGGGWYETDFKTDKEGKRNLAGSDRDESTPSAVTKSDDKTTKPKEGGAGNATGGSSDGAGSAGGGDSKPAAAPAEKASKSQSKSRGSAAAPVKAKPKVKAKAKAPARKKGRR